MLAVATMQLHNIITGVAQVPTVPTIMYVVLHIVSSWNQESLKYPLIHYCWPYNDTLHCTMYLLPEFQTADKKWPNKAIAS